MSPALALVGLLVAAQAPAQPPSAETSPLARLAPLVGPTWRAAFPDGGLHDTQVFEWMLGGAFLRNVHRVTNAAGEAVYEGETVYGWDPREERLRFWYFNTTGGYVTGDVTEADGRWTAEGENRGPEGQAARVRSVIALTEGRWALTSFFLQDGEWTERFTMEFERVD